MKPLRLWPGVVVAIIVVILRFIAPGAIPNGFIIGGLGAAVGGVLVVLWWLFFSRAPWAERLLAIVLMAVGILVTMLIAHPSMSGIMVPVILVPGTLVPAFVAWAVLTRRSSTSVRRATMALAILAGCGVWALARVDNIVVNGGTLFAWRWTPTGEERLLAETRNEVLPAPAPAAPAPATNDTESKPAVAAVAPVDYGISRVAWSGFRGPNRDGVIQNTRMRTDWASAAPKEIWRRRIGPGWSSFAVAGDLIFTQEQRGEQEVVSAYRLSTGAPVWRHQDNARFYDTAGGAGPRGTPTVHNGRVYTMGATGIVNALDATTGARVWTRNAQQDTGAVQPGWGFAASPVVYGDLVITAASGRLVAYNVNTGAPKWTRTTGGGGYSSPHLATIDGVEQILLQKGGGVIGVALDGTVLWDHKGGDGVAMLQPVVLGDGSLLVASADMMVGLGVRRLQVSRHHDGTWKVEERWMSRGLKPYFDDYVAHKGHAYGFDGTILSAINLETGERVWKGGRYGNGQLLLLPDQDLLLVTSEQGEVVLVAASPDKQTEIAKFKAIEGTTWNHPVLVGDVLLVRNGEEMAAFRLPK
jgi:outer membrane protein assembly factor BamB